jgi:ORF6N domain-containing protein
MLDADLADLYGVPTRALVQAVKRNLERFPSDFMFQLTEQEVSALKSQSVTLPDVALRYWGRRRRVPYAFSELTKKLDELELRVTGHDEAITRIVRTIRELATPVETKPRRHIGFV